MKADSLLRPEPDDRNRTGDVTFVVTIALKPDVAEEFLDLLVPVLDAMRHEPSFVNAVLHQDPEDPTRFMLYETWADLDDVVEVQMHREYRKAYWDRLPALLREPRRIETWRPMRRDFAFFAAW
jgi:quinol monooxygenase YgiN